MKNKYDVLVIGGGPAGALAGKTAAEKGLSALIVEKRPAIGPRYGVRRVSGRKRSLSSSNPIRAGSPLRCMAPVSLPLTGFL